ncbi:hypothetical protein M6B38_312730 [Iris pallida]|uniref:Uncharacterized protein n=1 Tax=Iris pallida TaxID=29817 RepID=A0AAX6HGD6_IRIPA|nr:hypothetical protein M6B38_312730 [Iris pallida]
MFSKKYCVFLTQILCTLDWIFYNKQGKYTDSNSLLCISVLFHVLILTRCTHDCSLFIVHRSLFIVHCSLLVHWVGK